MMKSIAVAAFLVWTFGVSAVVSEIVPFVMYNGGVTTTTKFCNPVEWAVVTGDLYKAFKPGRRLGEKVEQSSEQQNTPVSRELAWCDGKYSSWKPGCGGLASRRLQGSTPVCSADIAKFNTTLNGLLSSPILSSACKAYIAPTSRTYSCREIMECHIKGIALWNAETKKLNTTALPSNGTKICSTFKANFQATTDFDVGDVTYVIKSDKGYSLTRTEGSEPYFAFGNSGYTDIYTKKLDVGNYTLSAVPIHAPAKSVTIQFEIVPC
jgi:hypothetical protein